MNMLDKSVKLVEYALVIMFGIMAILVFGNVVLRYGFNSGIVFAEEVPRFLFMWLTLIGALIVMKDHAHLGMNSVIKLFNNRGRRICRFLADTMTLICCIMLIDGSWKQVAISIVDHAPVTDIPMGYIQSSLLISSTGMALVLGHRIWRLLTGRMSNEELIQSNEGIGE